MHENLSRPDFDSGARRLEKKAVESIHPEDGPRRKTNPLESLAIHSPLAIVTLDESQKVVTCNAWFEQLFQYSESEIKGRNLDEMIVGQEHLASARLHTSRSMEGDSVHGSGIRLRKDGSPVEVEFF